MSGWQIALGWLAGIAVTVFVLWLLTMAVLIALGEWPEPEHVYERRRREKIARRAARRR